MDIVAFEPLHRAACLALFDRNTPAYFHPSERPSYEAFLAHADTDPRTEYFSCVLEDDIVAAGGLTEGKPGVRHVRWIIVSREFHGRGTGRRLMVHLMTRAARDGAQLLEIAASQWSEPFFGAFGATRTGFIADGWGPRMHRVDMTLILTRP